MWALEDRPVNEEEDVQGELPGDVETIDELVGDIGSFFTSTCGPGSLSDVPAVGGESGLGGVFGGGFGATYLRSAVSQASLLNTEEDDEPWTMGVGRAPGTDCVTLSMT